MTAPQVVAWLRERGNPNTARIYVRHGAADETLGVAYKDLNPLAKKLGVNHTLSLALWQTGLHEARVMAAKIADPSIMTRSQIQAWVQDCRDYILSGAVAGVAARMGAARDLAAKWSGAKPEFTAVAGWNVYANLAMAAGLDAAQAEALVARIRDGIHAAPNRARHSMNGALIAIGGSMPDVRRHALAAAKAIGKVEVDHGETGCVTPDAVPYIGRMAARPPGRGRARC